MSLPLLSGCVAALALTCALPDAAAQTGVPPLPAVRSVVDLGLVQQNQYVNCRDGTYSARIGQRAVWTFNDTCLTARGVAGDQFIDNTLAWDRDFDASAGIRLEGDYEDRLGVPKRFVPFTENEIAFNAEHAPNEVVIWPGHIVPDPARRRALVFYGAVYRGSEIGFRGIGAGIAVASLDLKTVTRPPQNPDPAAPEPAYMWQRGEMSYTGGYLVEGEMLYAYGGEGRFFRTLVHVARVPLADALDKSRWTYWDGRTWQADPSKSEHVYVGGAAGDTLFWSDYLGAYVAVFQPYLSNDVFFRVAYRPEGPWSKPALLFTAQQGTDPSYAARVHAEYAKNGGQVQYVTYVKNMGLLSQQLPLVEVTFQKAE